MSLVDISYDIVNPTNLSDGDVGRICAIESDMWARNEGLGTYMYCEPCGKTFSKQDIYADKIDKILYAETVFEIERATKGEHLHCTCCGGELNHVFDKQDYTREIIERYSSGAMLLLMRREQEIVGFMDGHVSDYDTIYERDLSYRYPISRKDEISQAITKKCDDILPERMFSCSSMGTVESYMHFHYIYGLLQNFFGNFPEEFENDVGISELNSGGSLDKIYRSLGSESIGIRPGEENFQTDSYDSGLFIQRKLGRVYRKAFSPPLRDFLKNRKRQNKGGDDKTIG